MATSEPLRGRRLLELQELLRRQERLLGDRKFISKLPDKGKKILEFSEKLKTDILQEEELRRTEHLSAVRLEFQKKQEEIETSKQKTIVSSNKLTQEDSSSVSEFPAPVVNKEYSSALQNDLSIWTKKRSTKNKTEPLGKTEIAAQSTGSGSSETLVDAFERISIEGRTCAEKSEKGQNVNDGLLQHLPNRTSKIPHYIEVLELRANNPVTQKRKFKTNILPAELSGSAHSSPDISSPGSPSSSISAEERRQRDKKHLDDITAARLPPLHHTPTQLLSIAESIAIQLQQKEAYEEMQGKLAAQKLAEKLDIKMARFEPEGGDSGQLQRSAG
ncbi:hypothetical protein lerEdw1_008591 [Lerista edwardsae]|nr:hypothetical protein lerEdw1_008591 [Lerista edwardsae]